MTLKKKGGMKERERENGKRRRWRLRAFKSSRILREPEDVEERPKMVAQRVEKSFDTWLAE